MFRKKLRTYTVHIKTDEYNMLDDIVFVEEGFRWLAFLFAPFWGLFNKLWLVTIIYFVLYGTISTMHISGIIPVLSFSMLRLALDIILGFCADSFLRSKLKRKGYVLYSIVAGESEAQAQLRFIERRDINEIALV